MENGNIAKRIFQKLISFLRANTSQFILKRNEQEEKQQI